MRALTFGAPMPAWGCTVKILLVSEPYRKGLHCTSFLQKGLKLWFPIPLQRVFNPFEMVCKPFWKGSETLYVYDVNRHISGSNLDGEGIPPIAKIVLGVGTLGNTPWDNTSQFLEYLLHNQLTIERTNSCNN